MTTWTSPQDVIDQVLRLERRGELARRVVRGDDSIVPIRLRKPKATDVRSSLVAVRDWADQLQQVPGLQIEWAERLNRSVGRQKLPERAFFDDVWSAAAAARCSASLRLVKTLAETTTESCPELVAWLEQKPLKALAVSDDWPAILFVHRWIQQNPTSGLYARQLDLPGVHTKIVERHQVLLRELYESTGSVLPGVSAEGGKSGALALLGFRTKPPRLRFRLLDDFAGTDLPVEADVELDVVSLAKWNVCPSRFVIVENEITLLALPRMKDTVAVFGSGYGTAGWADLPWWNGASVVYWGDVDTHGFAILAQVRQVIPQVESVLMDAATLRRFVGLRSVDTKATAREIPGLTRDEQETLELLRSGELGDRVRIEQERIPLSVALPQLMASLGLDLA